MMGTSPEIVPVIIDRRDDVRRFLQHQYGENYYGANPDYFEWLYMSSPCNWFSKQRDAGWLPINVVLNDDGSLGAVHAFVPFDLWTATEPAAGIWDIEWINRTRIAGIGRMLA